MQFRTIWRAKEVKEKYADDIKFQMPRVSEGG